MYLHAPHFALIAQLAGHLLHLVFISSNRLHTALHNELFLTFDLETSFFDDLHIFFLASTKLFFFFLRLHTYADDILDLF